MKFCNILACLMICRCSSAIQFLPDALSMVALISRANLSVNRAPPRDCEIIGIDFGISFMP